MTNMSGIMGGILGVKIPLLCSTRGGINTRYQNCCRFQCQGYEKIPPGWNFHTYVPVCETYS